MSFNFSWNSGQIIETAGAPINPFRSLSIFSSPGKRVQPPLKSLPLYGNNCVSYRKEGKFSFIYDIPSGTRSCSVSTFMHPDASMSFSFSRYSGQITNPAEVHLNPNRS
ncbi:hypothetical protein TNCT_473031 [Trichonephila clavata]|uniref:Uncharacterized protein n=1 Tax=Trichonephila clavata TaxID=2740835 RepID=A0A8X6HVZ3_TRICU|nr:hypothetical protein TNCT_473031 [Trichonephila clavata]